MSRVAVLFIAFLAAVCLGADAQDHAAGAAEQSAGAPAQTAARNHETGSVAAAQQGPGAQDSSSGAATGDRDRGIEHPDSAASQTSQNQEAVPENARLPQTSTILPLLGLIGLGSLVAGLFTRR
ncbi:MAG TPA: hypothetical protein VFB00_05740 [Terriglobales bacterium]|nr:hypothetical protein [Terriglobales bacterium]